MVERAADPTAGTPETPLRERLIADLTDYQSAAYARRFADVVDRVDAAGSPQLTEAVARHLHKLMAYKDEYEVARLLLATSPKKAKWLLHPPMLRAVGFKNKIELGGWVKPAFWLLRSMRRLRGTPLDVAGWARVRRVERALVPEYIEAVDRVIAHLRDDDLDDNLDRSRRHLLAARQGARLRST